MKIKLSWLEKMALKILLPVLEKWLVERALVLPSAKKTEIQFRLKVQKEEIDAVEAALQAQAIAALEELAG